MILPPKRKLDKWGSGEYGASRGDRKHNGQDYSCFPDSILVSDVSGYVNRIGFPYSQKGDKAEFRLVEIKIDPQTIVKYFYLYPLVESGDFVKPGDQIGLVQNIAAHYPGMENHYHLEVLIEGDYVNPDQWLDNYIRGLKCNTVR